MRKPLLEQPRLTTSGAVVGRPRAQPPVDAALRIEKLAAEGRGVKGAALALRTDLSTLKRWFEEHPELRLAFERGKESERHELHQILVRDARDGAKPNIAAMFLLKSRHAYREGDLGELPSAVVINLPGSMDREQFLKTVVADDGRQPG